MGCRAAFDIAYVQSAILGPISEFETWVRCFWPPSICAAQLPMDGPLGRNDQLEAYYFVWLHSVSAFDKIQETCEEVEAIGAADNKEGCADQWPAKDSVPNLRIEAGPEEDAGLPDGFLQ